MPSYAIISDVHANLEALNAVLQAGEKENVDELLFLGDCVGYGPDPNLCIEMLYTSAGILLAGNHDRGAVGLTDISSFNPHARLALNWTSDTLTDHNKTVLKELPLIASVAEGDLLLVHASPYEPEHWHYITNEFNAFTAFRFFQERICVVGHSHRPLIAEQSVEGSITLHPERVTLNDRGRYLVNVGSVGQPRDGNPDAAYAIFRENTITIKRVPYDIVVTQKKMKKAGLSEYLINRLAAGR
ncbi:MAG: metallophosphoesterase family protein [Nitrospiraceae bacterium]|nr:MAG: metallophosphoesterase family protein [Nitrospiraceae bacterium]